MNSNKTINSPFSWSKRIATLAITSAIAATPLIGSQQAAQADPPKQAPAYGYRRGNDKNEAEWRRNRGRDWNRDRDRDRDRNRDRNRDRDRDRDDDRWDGDDRWNGRDDYNQIRSFSGIITRDLEGDRFEMRTTDGRTVIVDLRGDREPRRLTAGDRVRVRGAYSGRSNIFVATSLNIVNDRNNGDLNRGDWGNGGRDNGGWNNGGRGNGGWGSGGWNNGGIGNESDYRIPANFPGTVTSVTASNRLVVRGDNGRTYTVLGRNGFDSRISTGDRVRVVGNSRNSTVLADRVELTENRR
jgi:outer membrane lipoprotein SlyB